MAQRLPNREGVVAQASGEFVRIYNKSKQTVSLQVCPPNGDFYRAEQQAHIAPGKSATLPKDHLRWEQVDNLKQKQMLIVTYDSEAKQ
jgi:hypothetical protein